MKLFVFPLTKLDALCIILCLNLCAHKGLAQSMEQSVSPDGLDGTPFVAPSLEKMFIPVLTLEGWSLYGPSEKNSEIDNANRTDIMFRRFRIGAKGNPYNWLSYSLQLSLDRFGEDVYTALKGSYQGINLWNAYITAKLLKESQVLNLHAGYYWAGVSREYITSLWAVGSLDKTRSNWFLRHFITGKGDGIESGVGLGGLKNWQNVGISYRLGIYEPEAFVSEKYADKLYTGRIMVSIGQPEQKKYKYMVSGNQWRNRKGITFGVGASNQKNGQLSDTVVFSSSFAYGADVLIDYKGLRFDAEYYIFTRSADGYSNFEGSQYHIRFGYSFVFDNKYLEPAICYDTYNGTGNDVLYKYIGVDNTLDFGLNWYMNKDKLKLALHYVIQDGTVSKTGDYIGLALQFKL